MKTLINFRLEPEEHERLRQIARAQERSIATVIRRALAPLLQARPASSRKESRLPVTGEQGAHP